MFNWNGMEKTKERMLALWSGETPDRCIISVPVVKKWDWVPGYYQKPQDNQGRLAYHYEPEKIYARNRLRKDNLYFGGDCLPLIWPDFGTAGHAKYYSCAKWNIGADTIWFEPSLSDLDPGLLDYTASNRWLQQELETVGQLCRLAGEEFMVSLPDNGGILDAVAHLRGTQTLLTDLIDSPEEVEACLEKMTADYLDSLFQFFAVIKENNLGGRSHGWMNTWCPGTHVQMQVDFSVMLSPNMYEQFALPELHKISSAVDHSIYHLDGQEQIRHLDMILSVPGIDLIQWATVEGQPKTSQQMATLKRIQKAGKGLVLMPQPDEVACLLSELSCKGLVLIVNGVNTPEEADELISFADKASHP